MAEEMQFIDVPNVPAKDSGPDVVVLKMANSELPVFKESRDKDYIKYGADNLFPEYLTYLFNKSAKHNAIIGGKAAYIFGKGYENGNISVNRCGDSLNDVSKKSIIDTEIYGGYRWEIIWGFNKKIAEIYHVDYTCLRKGKDGGFWFKETWAAGQRVEPHFIPAFDPNNPVGSQIFEFNEYRPGVRYYPLPGYIGANNYIETDIEISIYYLSSIRNGMMPSKMIQFYSGDATDEKKREIERRWERKFSGAGNAGKFVLVFNAANAQKGVEINDLSASELDKHFQELNKTTQQEIYAGHNITSPMLFGIKTEGQLGGTTELQTAYGIFQNTYSKPKAAAFDKETNWVLSYSNFAAAYELMPSDPIGVQFDVKDVLKVLPKQFILEKLGVPKDMWVLPRMDEAGIEPTLSASPGVMVNDTIKNLTGRQMQGIQRIQRQYENADNRMTWKQAATMLKSGFGLSDEDVIAFIGNEPAPVQMSATPDLVLDVFDQFGDSKNDYEIVKSKKVCFSKMNEMPDDENIWIEEAFKTYDITFTENKIIELIKKDPLINSDTIAGVIGETKAFVEKRITSLVSRGYLETSVVDGVLNTVIPKGLDILKPPIKKNTTNPTQIYIKYSYEGPEDSRNRLFCAKMMQLNRLYSRYDIEQISERLGYSVFDRRGGFWNDGTTILPHCRHHFKSNIVIRKAN